MNNVYVTATLAVGACLPIMAYSNGTLGKALGSPYLATLFVFLIAALSMVLVITLTNTALPSIASIGHTNWTMWMGGFIVVMNILTFTIVPQKIGIGNMIILFIAGQIISSVVIDHFGLFHFQQHPINWQRATGVLLLLSGVVLIKKF
ncbi:MAG: DMT family transporter [Cyclobacteriaceae bacterium]|nr:DMT family transporter [Cyclobacteriaceae bacterium]